MESTHRVFPNLRVLRVLVLLGPLLLFSACSTLISGYNSEFQCPNTDKGKCVSVKEAYRESVGGTENNPLVKEKPEARGEDKNHCSNCDREAEASGQQEVSPAQRSGLPAVHSQAGGDENQQPEYSYRDALYKKLSSTIGKPSTPLVVPPEMVRVLILSYTGSNNELFSYRYVYFFATEPKWVISTSKACPTTAGGEVD